MHRLVEKAEEMGRDLGRKGAKKRVAETEDTARRPSQSSHRTSGEEVLETVERIPRSST